MAKRNKVEVELRYDYMFDSYVYYTKLAYEEYKNSLIQYLKNTWICDDGSLGVLSMDYYNNEINNKRKAFDKAFQEMNEFKILHGDKIEKLKHK